MSATTTVVILMAMAEEAAPIIGELGLVRNGRLLATPLPMVVYEGCVDDLFIALVVNGVDERFGVANVGTQPAVLSAYVAIQQYNPDLIINAGTAGGFGQRGCQIGDVYISAGSFKFHDRRIPLPGYTEYGIGSYPAENTTAMAQALGLKQGAISTGNSLDKTHTDLDMMGVCDADVKEMEAAAIAWVAWLYGKPMIALKAITDLVDSPVRPEEQFVDNLAAASENLCQKVVEVLHYYTEDGPALSLRHKLPAIYA